MNATRVKAATLAALMALTACGGGGGSSPLASNGDASGSTPAPAPSPAPAPAPAPSPAPAPAPAPAQLGQGQNASVAQLANGNYVAAWGNVAQLFDSNGQKTGGPITVLSTGKVGFTVQVTGVTALPDGSFMVTGYSRGNHPATNIHDVRLYAQKVSASGTLLPTGGKSDPDMNGGLADLLLVGDPTEVDSYWAGPFFINADGSYVLAYRQAAHPTPDTSWAEFLLNVDSAGNVVSDPVVLGSTVDYRELPAVTRMSSGNFLFAIEPIVPGGGVPGIGPVTWKVVTAGGQVIAQQSLDSGTVAPAVTALADGTALLTWLPSSNAATPSAERIDSSGNVVGTAPTPANSSPGFSMQVTGLSGGGYVFTWLSGSQLMAQYLTTSGAPSGGQFVLADNATASQQLAAEPPYSVSATGSGFIVVYSGTDGQIYEVQATTPPLG